MRSRSNSRGRKARLKTSARSLLFACALAFLTMPRASFGAPLRTAGPQGPAQRAPMVSSLMVCDPPTYQNCRRVEGATPARVIHSEIPVYPLAARRARLEGVSVVSLIVDDKGMTKKCVDGPLDCRGRVSRASRRSIGDGQNRSSLREEVSFHAGNARWQTGGDTDQVGYELPSHSREMNARHRGFTSRIAGRSLPPKLEALAAPVPPSAP